MNLTNRQINEGNADVNRDYRDMNVDVIDTVRHMRDTMWQNTIPNIRTQQGNVEQMTRFIAESLRHQ